MALLSANCIVCERVIQEKDEVISAFRIVDLFFAQVKPGLPIEQQAIPVNILGILRVTADDAAEHSVSLTLSGPGRTEPTQLPLSSGEPIGPGRFPGLPRMVGISAQLAVIPHLGTYEISVSFDGQEVARNQFTVIEPPVAQVQTTVDGAPEPQGRPQ